MTIQPLSILTQSLLHPRDSSTSSKTSLTTSDIPQDSAADLSPEAIFLSKLQQLQEQDPEKFKQFASQLADGFTKAAAEAKSNGDTTRANQLTKAADLLQNAAKTGQAPGAQDLQQTGLPGASGASAQGHHGHHHGHHSEPSSQTDPVSSLLALPTQGA